MLLFVAESKLSNFYVFRARGHLKKTYNSGETVSSIIGCTGNRRMSVHPKLTIIFKLKEVSYAHQGYIYLIKK